ncbi:MAG: hypothetical protein L6Q71_07860 [Planctomycetes bacterium]|nr:hypothetical protein [Planctomycetota bacterium]
MRDAQSKLDQLIAFRGEKVALKDVEEVFGLVGQARLVELLGLLRAGDTRGVFTFVEDVFSSGKDLRSFLVGLIGTLRDALLLATCGAEIRTLDMTGDARAVLEKEAKQWSSESLVYAIDMLNECGRYLKSSEYPRVALESALFKLCRIGDLRPIEDVIAAVEALIAQSPAPAAPTSAAMAPADKKKVLASDELPVVVPAAAVPYPQEGRSAPVQPPRPAPVRGGELPESFAKAKALIQEVFNVSEEHLS